jgi:hypothetical protein
MYIAGVALLIVLMLSTAGVLVTGIVLMAKGGEANRKYGNKLMVARVALQGAALAMVVLLLMTRSH